MGLNVIVSDAHAFEMFLLLSGFSVIIIWLYKVETRVREGSCKVST